MKTIRYIRTLGLKLRLNAAPDSQSSEDRFPALDEILRLEERPALAHEPLPRQLVRLALQNLAPARTHVACCPQRDVVEVLEDYEHY